MATETEAYLDEILSVLRVAHTHYDLSDPSAVQLGIWLQPPVEPFVCLGYVGTTNGQGPPMRQWETTVTVELNGWATVDGQTPADAQRAALRLASDVRAALYDAFRNPSSILCGLRTFVVDLGAVNGDLAAMAPGYGVVAGSLSWTVKTTDTKRGL
jgi:hypothetical protein